MKVGDNVNFKPNTEFGIKLTGILHSIDKGYRAYIYTDKIISETGIVKGDLVKVLLSEGSLRKSN